MPEPRTLQPVQFFKDLGEARGQNRVQDFRPRVVKGDPLGDYTTTDEDPAVVIVTEPNEPALPLVDATDVPEPDTTAEEDEDQSSVDDLLTRTDDQESIAAHGTPDGG